jgi:hypothetical protein
MTKFPLSKLHDANSADESLCRGGYRGGYGSVHTLRNDFVPLAFIRQSILFIYNGRNQIVPHLPLHPLLNKILDAPLKPR